MPVFNENGATQVPSATAEFAFMETGDPGLKNCNPAQIGERLAIDGYGSPQVATIQALRDSASAATIIYVKAHTTTGDGGHGDFRLVTGAAPGTYVDNNGTIIVPTGGDGSESWLRIYSGAVNVQWFGADGDGITDDTAALQSAITVAGSGVLELGESKTYKITAALTFPSDDLTIIGNNSTINGSTIAASTTLDDKYALKIEGSIGAAVLLTADLTEGAVSVPVDTTGIVAGDVVFIYSTEAWPEGATGGTSYKGAMHRVRSIDSAASLTLMDGVFFSYAMASGASLKKVTPRKNITIKNLRVVMGGANKAHSGIRMKYTVNCKLIDCQTNDTEDTGVHASYTIGCGVYGGDFSNATSPGDGSSGVTGNTGYGVLPGTATRNFEVVGAAFRNCRHAVAGGGTYPAIHVLVKKNFVDGNRSSALAATYALDCHEDTLYWIFDSNHVSGANTTTGTSGILVRGQKARVINNTVTNSQQYGILIQNFDTGGSSSVGAIVTGNIITKPRLDGIVVLGATATPQSQIIIKGNQIYSPGSDGITLWGTTYALVAGNLLYDVNGSSKSAIRLVGTAATAGNFCKHITVQGNISTASALNGLRADYADSLVVSNNQFLATVSESISLANCTEVSVNGGKLSTSGATRSGVYISASTKVAVNGIMAENTNTASGAASGVYILGASEDVTVAGSVFNGFVRGVYSASPANYISVAGVNGRNCTTASVDVSASANTAVAGNL